MLRSCKYCGKIHDTKFDCGKKPTSAKKVTDKDKFRWTEVWKNKRTEIKKRDQYLCQVCKRRLYDYGARRYNYDELEVHHIESLEKNFNRRVDNFNLITLCRHHHEMAEKKEIPPQLLLRVAKEQGTPPTIDGRF